MKNLKTTMVSQARALSVAIIAFLIGAIVIGIGWGCVEYQEQKDKNSNYEIVCDVVAENDEFYILQNCDDANSFIQIDKSEMFGVGETVIVVYVENQITSVWLYVDC